MTVSDSITNISSSMFDYCSNIKDIYYIGDAEKGQNLSYIFNHSSNTTIHFCHRFIYKSHGGINIPQNQYAEQNKSFTISPETPVRTGYSFLGWATTEDAETAEYQPGDTIQIGTEDITLYAVWKKVSYTTTALNLADNKSVFTIVPTEIPIGSNIILVCYNNGIITYAKSKENNNEPREFTVTSEYDKAMVFVFDGSDGVTPLTDAENVNLDKLQ